MFWFNFFVTSSISIFHHHNLNYKIQNRKIQNLHFFECSGLRFLLSSNFPGALMQSSLMGKMLLCALVSTLYWRLIFRFFSGSIISSVTKASLRGSCIEFRKSFIASTCMVLIVRILSLSLSPLSSIAWILLLKTGFVPWLNCFRLLERQTDCQWLPLPHFRISIKL